MRYKQLGKTGIELSEYGLGTWAMGGGAYGPTDDEESIATIHRAQEQGVTFLDTAPMYGHKVDGRSETVCGRALKGRRDQWILSTKFGRSLVLDANNKSIIQEDYSSKNILASTETSLNRLETDYLDVLFVHTPSPDQPGLFNPEEAFSTMAKLKAQGKIRAVGFSFHLYSGSWLEEIEPFLRSGAVDVVQVGISLMLPEPVDKLLPIIKETGTGFIARESLANGFLTDSFTVDGPFGPGDPKANLAREKIQEKLDKANQFKFLVDRSPEISSLPQAALHWTVSIPEVSTVIPGAKNIKELEQCISGADAAPFDQATMDEISAIQKTWGDWKIYG
jgi:aryl-alcohol dehydrogenase-like predicted oxidoreductase